MQRCYSRNFFILKKFLLVEQRLLVQKMGWVGAVQKHVSALPPILVLSAMTRSEKPYWRSRNCDPMRGVINKVGQRHERDCWKTDFCVFRNRLA